MNPKIHASIVAVAALLLAATLGSGTAYAHGMSVWLDTDGDGVGDVCFVADDRANSRFTPAPDGYGLPRANGETEVIVALKHDGGRCDLP